MSGGGKGLRAGTFFLPHIGRCMFPLRPLSRLVGLRVLATNGMRMTDKCIEAGGGEEHDRGCSACASAGLGPGNSATCFGDSGGPSFIYDANGQPIQVGGRVGMSAPMLVGMAMGWWAWR